VPTGLNSDDYWREPAEDIELGDVFAGVPFPSVVELPLWVQDQEEQVNFPALPASFQFGLLFRRLPQSWWFLPVLPPDSFQDPDIFLDLHDRGRGSARGWFPLPPKRDSVALAVPSLVLVIRPIVHLPELFDVIPDVRLGSLTESAFRDVNNLFQKVVVDH
jgi:hypothetical protein